MLTTLKLYRQIILLQNELAAAQAEIARLKGQAKPRRLRTVRAASAAVPDLDAMTAAEVVAYINAHPEAVSPR